MAVPEVLEKIAEKASALKAEKARLPDARIFYKWYIDGALSKGGAEEVPAESIDQFVRYWVGQGFYLEQKSDPAGDVIWIRIWEYGQPEPAWERVMDRSGASDR